MTIHPIIAANDAVTAAREALAKAESYLAETIARYSESKTGGKRPPPGLTASRTTRQPKTRPEANSGPANGHSETPSPANADRVYAAFAGAGIQGATAPQISEATGLAMGAVRSAIQSLARQDKLTKLDRGVYAAIFEDAPAYENGAAEAVAE